MKISKMLLVLSLTGTALGGCGLGQVKPWERGMLAEDKMQLVPYPVENSLDEHIYFSKEAASGGQGVGGGGCGCN
jgi:hypothetical protein